MARSVLYRTAAVSFLLLAGRATYAQRTFAVGTAIVESGENANGFPEVPAGVDAGTKIPVVVIKEVKPGPVLALVAGSHGTEYASIIALEKLIAALGPAGISGTVIILPLVHQPSFEQRVVRVNPVDGKRRNCFYPGKAEGARTEPALWAITQQGVEKCNYLFDYHGGDLGENPRPYGYWLHTGNVNRDRIAKEIVLASGLDHIIVNDRRKKPQASKYLGNTAAHRGRPTFTVEAGHAGTTDTDEIALLVNRTFNVMQCRKMLGGAATYIQHRGQPRVCRSVPRKRRLNNVS